MATRADTQDILETAQPRAARMERRNLRIARPQKPAVAQALGWFSIGLGVAEVLAPRMIARLIGTRDNANLIRAYGMREIAAGIGILIQPKPVGWLWARVGGDVVDISSLGAALGSKRTDTGSATAAMLAVGGVTALDVFTALQMTRTLRPRRIAASVIVNRSPEECYRFWRNFENLPRFMTYVDSVRITGDRVSHWVVRAPGNVRVEWDAEIVDDISGRRIAWHSLPGADVIHAGTVQFEPAPADRGTIVRVRFEYDHPGRTLSSVVGKLVGRDPRQMVEKDLRRFKQVLETGEVLTTEGQSSGRRSGTTWLDSIAR